MLCSSGERTIDNEIPSFCLSKSLSLRCCLPLTVVAMTGITFFIGSIFSTFMYCSHWCCMDFNKSKGSIWYCSTVWRSSINIEVRFDRKFKYDWIDSDEGSAEKRGNNEIDLVDDVDWISWGISEAVVSCSTGFCSRLRRFNDGQPRMNSFNRDESKQRIQEKKRDFPFFLPDSWLNASSNSSSEGNSIGNRSCRLLLERRRCVRKGSHCPVKSSSSELRLLEERSSSWRRMALKRLGIWISALEVALIVTSKGHWSSWSISTRWLSDRSSDRSRVQPCRPMLVNNWLLRARRTFKLMKCSMPFKRVRRLLETSRYFKRGVWTDSREVIRLRDMFKYSNWFNCRWICSSQLF